MKIAVVDSGIHAGHPHVGAVAGGIDFTGDDWSDRLGHGTAAAGAVREKAPGAELYAVKIFDRRLSTTIGTIVRALAWCAEHQMDLVNLSLGTTNAEHREAFERAVLGLTVVSAAGALPGVLDGVIAVAADLDCPRDAFHYRNGVFYASPYPRPIRGVPPERNLHGSSFAVANMTGFTAQLLETVAPAELRAALIRRARA